MYLKQVKLQLKQKSQPTEKPVQTKTEPKPAPKREDGFDSVDLSEFS